VTLVDDDTPEALASGETFPALTAEELRLRDARHGVEWRMWGPYLSERQWGTVREDYSETGEAWDYFSHDQARSRAYRWGEDGLAGISDDKQRLCFALALWNGRDPILKERLFGLTNSEGNHGEDVKEYYFYLDNLPTHSYQRWLYKYPQAAYPYEDLVRTNRSRSRQELEYELVNTGVFDEGRYFDVLVEYAKAGPLDIACRITVANRGPEAAELHLLPTLWYRNTWSWPPHTAQPRVRRHPTIGEAVVADHPELGRYELHVESPNTADRNGTPSFLFCENESNARRLWNVEGSTPYPKDGINDHLLFGAPTVNPDGEGSKVAAHLSVTVPAGGEVVLRCRLTRSESQDGEAGRAPFDGFDDLVAARRAEADEFYAAITPHAVDADSASIMRQALAGMLWSKQCYYFDVDIWLREHEAHPLRSPRRRGARNEAWFHMVNHDVISMPDKWEYPWYAAWDLAFHTIPLAMVDPDFAKGQLDLMLSQAYLHPTGQIPAYEWAFSDVNPPVHAFATVLLHAVEVALAEGGKDPDGIDLDFLSESFQKLLLNFTWWVNRKDPAGKNLFEGGFLGLDNVGVFDRSAPVPGGGRLEQADGTAWMALFSQNMLELACILAERDETYEEFVLKFIERFFWIAAAIDPVGSRPDELWDEEDGFYFDVLRMPDGTGQRLKIRSVVGLLPMCATTAIPAEVLEKFPHLRDRVRDYLERNHDLLVNIADPTVPGVGGRHLLSLVNEEKLRRILDRMLDEERFLGPHGIRSISRWHLDHPYSINLDGHEYRVDYEAAESSTGAFGGNSNWRGPIWFPTNLLIIRALLQHYLYYGDAFTIECPTGSGRVMTLFDVAQEITRRLISIFRRGPDGRRPVYGGTTIFQEDPHWRDLILFYEYFHGDNGAGLGASHQTGWTGLVARMIQLTSTLTGEELLREGRRSLSRPFRHLTGEPMADAARARETRGVRLGDQPVS
jgi:Mannosylglycerate hydrolase MGH1-like glycoside hydrolase domain